MSHWQAFISIVTTGNYVWSRYLGNTFTSEQAAKDAAVADCTTLQNQITTSLSGLLGTGFVAVDVSYPAGTQPSVRLRSSQIVALYPQVTQFD